MFELVCSAGRDVCHHCKQHIATVDELSIEHMTPWLSAPNPTEAFFDLKNISFSHFRCNVAAAAQPSKHPSPEAKAAAKRVSRRKYARRTYTPEKRRAQYERTGN